MVLVGEASRPEATWEFDADIAILTHSTTIQPRYQAVIHCEIVRQVLEKRRVAMRPSSDILRGYRPAWLCEWLTCHSGNHVLNPHKVISLVQVCSINSIPCIRLQR